MQTGKHCRKTKTKMIKSYTHNTDCLQENMISTCNYVIKSKLTRTSINGEAWIKSDAYSVPYYFYWFLIGHLKSMLASDWSSLYFNWFLIGHLKSLLVSNWPSHFYSGFWLDTSQRFAGQWLVITHCLTSSLQWCGFCSN